ncbi:discoidin domain-containing protein [Roseateles sp. SL47]|uniref:discoidin domain-containing protein n=1 Tax=Roseateles sp. SL47 TaxID=2995138 RepID=UPI002271267A|nr:discoidin domain-containing protein [Roseateles sp. SL47]WAC75724.1 discoidin domain-containing protein [Roseateles sp. SL47]
MSGEGGTATALTPVSATGSSMERGDLNGAQAINKQDTSRWGSAFTDNEWLTLDYRSSVNISRVRINWENAHATTYLLQRPEDNTPWTTTKTVGNNNSLPTAFQQPPPRPSPSR